MSDGLPASIIISPNRGCDNSWRMDAAPHLPPQLKPDELEPMLYCPVCSRRLSERKCKLLCEQCGYYMSCADYY